MNTLAITLQLGSLVVTYLIHSTILIGIVWVTLKVLRPKAPQIRENLLRVALLGSVATVALQLSLTLPHWGSKWSPVTKLDTSPSPLESPPSKQSTSTIPALVPPEPVSEHRPLDPAPLPRRFPSLSIPDSEPPSPSASVATPEEESLPKWNSWRVMAWILITGWTIGVLRLATQIWGLCQRRRHSQPTPAKIQQSVESLAKRMRYNRPAECRLASDHSTPIAAGFWKKWIILPADLYQRLPDEQVEAVLAHELAHLVRRDSWWTLLTQVIGLLFFFQPLHLWVKRQLRIEAEYLADQRAAQILPNRSDLALCLLTVGEWLSRTSRPVVPLASGMSAYKSLLAKRVQCLVDGNPHHRPNRWLAGAWASLSMVALGSIAFGAPRVLVEPNQNNEKDNDMNTMKATATMIAASVGLVTANPKSPNAPEAKEGPISIEKVADGGKGGYVVRIGDQPFTTLLCGELLNAAGVPTNRTEFEKHRVRPIFYPIYGPDGTKMTRDFPFSKETKSEAHDHPHHESLWYGHGNVNGVNFWHVGKEMGTIHQTGRAVHKNSIWMGHDWNGPNGELVCEDMRRMTFWTLPDGGRVIQFSIEIFATDQDVTFGDTKEGTMALRSTPNLRIDKGAEATNSAGHKGKSIWGKAAKWVNYQKENSGFAIFDHPKNPRHPTTWHARDYGLVAANPFGASHFSGAKPGTGNLVIRKGDSVTFHYAFLFHRGSLSMEGIEKIYTDWTKQEIKEP